MGALLFLLGRQTTTLQFMRRQQHPTPTIYPIGSPVAYHEPNTPMTHNSFTATYACPEYGTHENEVELGSTGTTIQPYGSPTPDSSQVDSMYSDQFDKYRRQKFTGSPTPPMSTPLEFPW